jgi:AcrR family transcriptional regulator
MSKKPAADPRSLVVDALMALAAEKPWGMITLSEIAEKAGLSLADLRDLFPSKGAILGGFVRRIDRIVLEGKPGDMAEETARERVLDLMMRRFDALSPYREALKSIRKGFAGDPLGLMALNQQALNSWRYMLESAGIELEGPLGALRIQGAILVFARAFETFLTDEDPMLARTMAVLDKELARGEWVMKRAEGLDRIMTPFAGLCRALRKGASGMRNRDAEKAA